MVGYDGELVYLASTFVSAYSSARKHIYLILNAVWVRSDKMGTDGE